MNSSIRNVFIFAIALASAAAGSAQNTFPSSGNVGIGTTSPASSLDIAGGANLLHASDTYGSYYLRVASTTGQGQEMHLRANAGKSNFLSFTEDSIADRWVIKSLAGDSSLYLSAGSPSSNKNVLIFGPSGDVLTVWDTYGSYHMREASTTGQEMHLRANAGKNNFLSFTEDTVADRWVIKSLTGDSNLYLATGSPSNNSNIVTFAASGSVGFGTTSPSYAIDVQKPQANANILSTSSNYNAWLHVAVAGPATGNPIVDLWSGGVQEWQLGIDSVDGGKLKLQVGGAALGSSAAVTVLPNGNFGIGTTNAAAKLDVVGVVRNQGVQITNLASAAYLGTDASGNLIAVAGGGAGGNVTATQITNALGYTPASQAGGSFTGAISSPSVTSTSGLISGGSTGLTINAGGTNQNVTISPSGTGTTGINGNVSIGTLTADARLTVKGRVHATEVVVDTTIAAKDLNVQPSAWADDVFDVRYHNAPLSEVEHQIKAHGHLAGVPSASEVAEKGVNLGQMQAVLLQKIEELTLHQIEQEKEIAALKATIRTLSAQASTQPAQQ